MKGLITEVLKDVAKKGKSLKVAQRYLKAKHKIKTSMNVLKKRYNDIKVIQRGKEWDN